MMNSYTECGRHLESMAISLKRIADALEQRIEIADTAPFSPVGTVVCEDGEHWYSANVLGGGCMRCGYRPGADR